MCLCLYEYIEQALGHICVCLYVYIEQALGYALLFI